MGGLEEETLVVGAEGAAGADIVVCYETVKAETVRWDGGKR